jgi:hypothetical protein
MNWPDEHYVKFYTRDTLTWHTWRWETRATFALLLRKVDGAGIIESGTMPAPQALAIQLGLPIEVTSVAVEQLLADGTCVQVRGGLLIPHFLEAQEAKRSEAIKKREQRDFERSRRRLDAATSQTAETPRQHVPSCPEMSPGVPPSPAQPSPAPLKATSSRLDGTLLELVQPIKPPPPPQALDEKLAEDEFDVFEHWRQVMGKPKARATAERKRLLAKQLRVYTVAELQRAVDGCATTPFNMGENKERRRYDSLELILRDAQHIETFMDAARGVAHVSR